MANFVDYVGKKKDIYRQREKDNKSTQRSRRLYSYVKDTCGE